MAHWGWIALVAALLAPGEAPAQTPNVRWGSIEIYQAEILNDVMPDEHWLANYMDRLQAVAEKALGDAHVDAAGLIFVAIRPNGHARVWLLDDNGAVSPELRASLEQSLSAVAPISVRHDFVFGLCFSSGRAAAYVAPNPPPISSGWTAQIPPEGAMRDDAFINRVWPN